MKKSILFATMLLCALSLGFTSCGSDDDDEISFEYAASLDVNNENIQAWSNYMGVVADLLKTDAEKLYASWFTAYDRGKSYGDIFKAHNNNSYNSAINCVEAIFDGCIDIAGEVGDQKIGEPYRLKVAGKDTEALYAVESWYSWHSRDDYTNNIYSIRNAFFGSLDGTIHKNSLSALLAEVNPVEEEELREAIIKTAASIQAIPQPFRNNIDSKEAQTAMQRCANLGEKLEKVKGIFQQQIKTDAELDPVIARYVDGVVLPTYKSLALKSAALADAVNAFRKSPSNAGFVTCCNAWLEAREPWESSEAFLFGPVADMGLDPNMDSWPLDQVGIVGILQSQNFNALSWDGEYDEESKKIESAQSLRGFHTLEYLIFKDGRARTLQSVAK